MADIELVIKIPEELKEALDNAEKENAFDYIRAFNDTIYHALKNGTPLPKGHGRIGDVDQMEYLKALHDAKFGKIKFSDAINKIKNSIPTIVEADKEESEDKCITCANNGMIDDECAYCTNHNLFKAKSEEK